MTVRPNTTLESFYDGLVEHGLIVPVARAGRVRARRRVRGRARALQRAGHRALATDDGAEVYTFPPVIDRTIIEKTDYLDSFPHLAGTVFSFFGKDKRRARRCRAKVHAGEPWGDTQGMTDVLPQPGRLLPGLPELRRHAARERALDHDDRTGCTGTSRRPSRRACSRSACASSCARHARHGRRVARHVARARPRAAESLGLPAQVGRRRRSVLRPRRQDARGRPEGAEAEVRGAGAGDLAREADRGVLVQLPPGALRRTLRHQDRRRRGRAHGVPRLRPRARRDGAVPDARLRSRARGRAARARSRLWP